jgi:PilZ domain-containing protein
VAWPVIVEADSGVLHLETVNVGPLGAKVKVTDKLREGTPVTLRFQPDDAPPFDISAVVWRVDPDGLVFFFVGVLE